MKTLFLLLALAPTALAAPCRLVVTKDSKDIATVKVPELKEMPERAQADGLYCHQKKQLFGYMSFQDHAGSKWQLKLTSELNQAGTTMTTIIALRDGKKMGPQTDVSFTEKSPCLLIKQKHVFSLVGLEDKNGSEFSVSLSCK